MYKFNESKTAVIEVSTGTSIPLPAGGEAGDRYMVWLDEGNTTLPADPPQVVPVDSVTMRQARLALLQIGKLGDVATAIAALPSPQKEAASIEWEYSNEVQRGNAFVATLGAALGLTEKQLDDLFALAATL